MSSHEGHILRIARARQDHSPQSMVYSSAPSSEKQYRTTVLRVCYTVLSPLQRSNTRPQCPEHGLQFCPLFREARQDHSPQSMVYSSAPSSEKQDRTTVPRAWSTVLPPQRSQTAAVVPWGNAARTAVGQHGGLSEDLHPDQPDWTSEAEPCSKADDDDEEEDEDDDEE